MEIECPKDAKNYGPYSRKTSATSGRRSFICLDAIYQQLAGDPSTDRSAAMPELPHAGRPQLYSKTDGRGGVGSFGGLHLPQEDGWRSSASVNDCKPALKFLPSSLPGR